MKLTRWCGAGAVLAASVLLSGCGHLAYTDPNPSTPFAFPGQQPANRVAVAPAPPNELLGTSIPARPQTGLDPVGRPPANVPVPQPNPLPSQGTIRVFSPGDLVTVTWADLPPDKPQQDWKGRVGEDGKITLPLNVTVVATGKTASQLEKDIRSEYVPRYFVRLTPTVKGEDLYYYVGGEVKIPNKQLYVGDMTVLRAIDTAGGFTDFADRTKVQLRRANGQKQVINWKKVNQDPRLDPVVYPNDQVFVPKRLF